MIWSDHHWYGRNERAPTRGTHAHRYPGSFFEGARNQL